MVTPHNLSLFPLQLRRLLLLLLLPLITHAQPPGSGQQTSAGSTTIVMIAILLGVFFFVGMLFLYIHRRRVITGGNGITWTITNRTTTTGGIQARGGLDPRVIESFPTMVYSDVKGLKVGEVALECAVCLCEFEDEDTLTMLPNCSHAFHPECIGMWLTSHHTCPVCRSDLRNAVPDDQGTSSTAGTGGEAQREDQVMISVDDEEEQDVAADLGSMASVCGRVTRSWSARAAVGGSWRMKGRKEWGAGERERFTLRLPEHIRNELMRSESSRRRSATAMTSRLNGGEESRRMGYREGMSFRRGTSVRAVWSDRWPYLRLSSCKGGGDIGPLDCLRGGGRSGRGNSGDGEDEKPTVVLTKH